MRDFCKISPQFWTGKTGKSLRGDAEAQIVALYLMTSPHSNMIGIFTLPIMYLSHETGLTIEGASKALARLSDAGFCTFEADSETVWVHEMARYQIGDQLDAKDKRCKGVQNELAKVASDHIRRGFALKYKYDFHLTVEGKKHKPLTSPIEAPCKQGEGEGEGEGESSLSVPDCPHESIISLFEKHLPTLPQPRKSLWREGKNAPALKARWRWVMTACHEKGKKAGERLALTSEDGLDWFDRFFSYVAKSDFLTGLDGNWSCDLIWLVNKSNFEKVIQGTYENKAKAT